VDLLVDPVGESKPLEPTVDRAIEPGLSRAFQRSVVPQQPAYRHPLVEPALFREVAHTIARGPRAALAPHLDLTLVGKETVQDHRGGRLLARPVRPDKPEKRPRRHSQVQIVDGDHIVETLGDTPDRDSGTHVTLERLKIKNARVAISGKG